MDNDKTLYSFPIISTRVETHSEASSQSSVVQGCEMFSVVKHGEDGGKLSCRENDIGRSPDELVVGGYEDRKPPDQNLPKSSITTSTNTIIKIIPNINASPDYNISSGARRSLSQLFNNKFDEITKNESRLLKHNYIKVSMNKKNYYLIKHTEKFDKIFVTQENLKVYMKIKFGITMFRSPDEAYITIPSDGSKVHIKILEKKELILIGSIETKLFTGPAFKREYNLILGDRFIVYYAFCVNSFLQKKMESSEKKYVILNQILNENEITVFYGNEWNYFAKLDEWLQVFGDSTPIFATQRIRM